MADPILIAQSKEPIFLLPKMANRHGLIAGATGTGKTVTLQTLAENFSGRGVPVFMADVKGGKVIRWSATDAKGKPLATKPVQASAEEGGGTIQLCQVCVQTLDPETNTIKTNFCYYIDCKNLPPAK